MASADDREKLLAQVKRDVRSLLISAKSGLAIQDLYRDYQSLVFSPLPFRKLGYETARTFLQSIPDVCQCQLLPGGDCLVTAVADSSTAHIQKMVERQKPSQKRGHTARVLSSRYLRRSTPARSTSYRPQPLMSTQTWYKSPSPSQPRPETKIQPLIPSKPEPDRAAEPQVNVPARGDGDRQEAPVGRASPELVPTRVAGRLAQLLLAQPDGINVDRLPEMYEAAKPDEEPLDWAGRGYRSCAELLLQLPHIARVVNAWAGLRVYPSRALLEADRQSSDAGRRSRQSGDAGRRSRQSTGAAADGDRPASRAAGDVRPSSGVAGDDVRPSSGAGGDSERPPSRSSRSRKRKEAVSPVDPERRPSPTGASGPVVTSGSSSSGRRKGLLASISETVQTIVEKHPNGLLCSKLPAEYQLRMGSDLALAELGFHSVLDLVSRLPLRIIKSNAFGDWLLFNLRQPLPDFVNDQTQADDGLIAEVEDGSRLQQAKERIRDILLSFPDGLRMASLEDHYQMNCNERLPYGALGFSSVETFVLHLTEDVLNVKFTHDGLKLFPIMPLQSEQSVSRDLYPGDSVGPGRSFERVKMPDVPSGEYNLEIFVAEVYHPHKFWFHLVGDDYADALEKLMDDMEMTYCTTVGFKYRMQEATVRVGQVCACPYGEQGYHRAVITGVRPAPEPVKVFYVDYGSVGTVSRDFLRFLPEDYFKLPAQALLGRLANIDPPDAEGWSREASKKFLSLVDNNRILFAMVLERSPSCVSLCLCDTNGATDIHVNDRLVELGYAMFRNQSVDVDEKAVEELSRPVSVAPSPRSAPAAPPAAAVQPDAVLAAVAAGAAARLSVSPEQLEQPAGRSTPSDIDRLLQETLGTGSPVTAAAGSSPTPVSPSVPGQPPGFYGVTPQPPLAPPPAASAPAASSAAFAQMLTQSVFNNLQMQMQLSSSLMNPMMNPAYAALLMSQAASGGAAVSAAVSAAAAGPACSVGQTPVTSAVSAGPLVPATAAPAAAVSVSTPPVSEVPPAAAAAVLHSPEVPVSSGAVPPPPLAPSVVSSGQDAGVCITAPIQAESAPSRQELTEEEIAQMNRELGELAIQRRFIKQIAVPVGVVHLICLDGAGYLVSAEISHFLWTRDILHTMLMMKRVTLPYRSVDVESHQELFAELVKYNVPGVLDGEDLVDPLTLYPITCVPRVFAVFKNMKNEHDVKGIIEDIIAEFDPADPYWTSADEEEDELAELYSDPAAGSPPPVSVPPRPASLRLDIAPPSPPPTELPDIALSVAATTLLPLEMDGDGEESADLLPEMRAILTQLQNKRRRKVEATMMGLQGTDFLPEDVIGDDLRRMDAQIASFQSRIDALVAARATGRSSSQQASAPAGRPAAVRTNSISMNPDAPEFIHPGKVESVYTSADNTICTETASRRPRAPVELRAPDGTPVDLCELVNRAEALQRQDSGSAAPPPPPARPSTPPRKPVELRTPDGKPVQLGRPVRAASTPHGSPPTLSAAGSTAPAVAAVQPGRQPPPPSAAQQHQAQHPPQPQHQPQLRLQHPPQPQHPAQLQPQPPPAAPPAGHQQPAARFSHPAIQPLRPPPAAAPPPPPPQPQPQPPQWPRLPLQPLMGMPLYAAPFQPPYLQYQPYQYQAAGPYQRLQQPMSFPQQQQPVYGLQQQQAGYQPAPTPYPPHPQQQPAQPAQPPTQPQPPANGYSGK